MTTTPQPSDTAKRTVLIAEDNEVHCRSIQITMEKAGWKASTTGHGRRALEMAVNHRFDLMILDQRLPEVQGTEIVKLLRARSIATPAIMVSSWANMELQKQAKEVGIARVIPSPIKPVALVQIVDRVMQETI